MKKEEQLIEELRALKNMDKAKALQGFFKTAKGDYGEGDVFWGISVPLQRKLISNYLDISLSSILKLLKNEVHELRFSAALILLNKYQSTVDLATKERIAKFYLKNLHLFNNWDLIDLSAHRILGDYLLKHQEKEALDILLNLASSTNLWRRRAALVASFSFIKVGRKEEVLRVVNFLQSDPHDLIAKASGWMLREVGKNIGEDILCEYLDKNYHKMSRVSLRYAIERLEEEKRQSYLKRV